MEAAVQGHYCQRINVGRGLKRYFFGPKEAKAALSCQEEKWGTRIGVKSLSKTRSNLFSNDSKGF
jgi:hypothetical protein